MKSQKATTTTDRQKKMYALSGEKWSCEKQILVGFLPECRVKFAGSPGQEDECSLDGK